jgi:hypothetical protein
MPRQWAESTASTESGSPQTWQVCRSWRILSRHHNVPGSSRRRPCPLRAGEHPPVVGSRRIALPGLVCWPSRPRVLELLEVRRCGRHFLTEHVFEHNRADIMVLSQGCTFRLTLTQYGRSDFLPDLVDDVFEAALAQIFAPGSQELFASDVRPCEKRNTVMAIEIVLHQ